MGIKNINVVLDNIPANGYPPGATITGRVILSAEARINIRSLSLKIHGEAYVSFNKVRTRRRIRQFRRRNGPGSVEVDTVQDTSMDIQRYVGQEDYFTTSYQILGETSIPAGEQEYLFTSVLPSVLPSTFNGLHGYIRYTLKVKLDKSWNFDQVAKIEFRVNSPKDLNNWPNINRSNILLHSLTEPLVYNRVKHFNCWCCKSGPVSLIVQVPKSGVVPGETLQLNIEIDNTTKVNIVRVDVILRQETIWIARSPKSNSKCTTDTLMVMKCEGVPKLNNKSWCHPIMIPSIPYINIDACSIIQLQHFIVVEAVSEGMHTNLTVVAPIVIGTIPLEFQTPYDSRRTYDPMYDPAQQPNIGFVMPTPTAPVDYGFNDRDLPPPYPSDSHPYPDNKASGRY